MVNSSLQNLLNNIVYTMILIYVQMFLNFFFDEAINLIFSFAYSYFFF